MALAAFLAMLENQPPVILKRKSRALAKPQMAHSLSISKADKMLFTAIFDTIQQNYVTEIDSLALVSAAVEGVRRTVTEKRHK